MKQHITPKQLAELSEKGKEKYFRWVSKYYPVKDAGGACSGYRGPLLSIGQMIELLKEKGWEAIELGEIHSKNACIVHCLRGKSAGKWFIEKTRCDALWQAVKEVLEK
jgi:hypothetical protein